MNALETIDLTKFYGERKVLNNVSLSIGKGDIYGLLGPNGAGKTTFLRIVNNILYKDSGTVLINGEPLSMKQSRHLGYMPEERGLYPKMRVDEQILYFGLLKGGDKQRLQKTMMEYMHIFQLTKDAKRKVQELSKGNQQKVQIIATLVHEPDIVMLDEPFSGFDPLNGVLLAQLLDRLKEQNTTIILSSHNMAAVEEICSNIALINKGELLLNGNIHQIKEDNKQNIIEIKTLSKVDFDSLKEKGMVDSLDYVAPTDNEPYWKWFVKKSTGVDNNTLITDVCTQTQIISFQEKLPSLNELFIRYTQNR
jgi:ABC-2 type transport system ATP-binding protein